MRLTIATCIGCGAMSLPGRCAGGCGSERRLELVAGSELDELIASEHAADRRVQALADVLSRFLALPAAEPPDELHGLARAVLSTQEQDWAAATSALQAEPEPVTAWWCEQCGGLDAPAPCLGVCVRRPAEWVSLDALQRQRDATAERLENERRLARAVRALALTRPRPGSEVRHWQALRAMAAAALAASPRVGTAARVGSAFRPVAQNYGVGVRPNPYGPASPLTHPRGDPPEKDRSR